MKLYLLRHAEAVDLMPDPARQLTHRGREDATALGEYLAQHPILQVAQIWQSPYLRARETTECLLAGHGRLTAQVTTVADLTPEDDPRTLDGRLASLRAPLLIVGHNPHLSLLTSWLLTGDCHRLGIDFRKATLVCIDLPSALRGSVRAAGNLRWMLSPTCYRTAAAED